MLDCRSSSLGAQSSHSYDHCVVILGKMFYSYCASPPLDLPQVDLISQTLVTRASGSNISNGRWNQELLKRTSRKSTPTLEMFQMGTNKLNPGQEVVLWGSTTIASHPGGSRNIPSLWQLEINCGLLDNWAETQTLHNYVPTSYPKQALNLQQ